MSGTPSTWTVRARNLPEHVDNPIHTDEGARAEGFPAALVAGTTTYVYLTHPLVAAWGTDWLTRGGGEVRFRAPVFADADLDCEATDHDGATLVEAVCPTEELNPRAILDAVRDGGAPVHRDGEALPSRTFTLGVDFAGDYAERAGDHLPVYAQEGIAHPVTWLQIANRIFSTDLINGPWIHTRSIVRHHALTPADAVLAVHANVIDRFDRGGRRAVVDVLIEHDGHPVATIEHEAIIDMTSGG